MAKSQYTHDLVATVGEYTNQAGEKKKQFQTCGKVFTGDDGSMSIKVSCVPVGPEWSGWFSLYPAKPREGQPQRQSRPAPSKPAPGEPQDDDIPF